MWLLWTKLGLRTEWLKDARVESFACLLGSAFLGGYRVDLLDANSPFQFLVADLLKTTIGAASGFGILSVSLAWIALVLLFGVECKGSKKETRQPTVSYRKWFATLCSGMRRVGYGMGLAVFVGTTSPVSAAIATYSYSGPPVRFGEMEWVGVPLVVNAPENTGFDSLVNLRVSLTITGGRNSDTIVRLQAPGDNGPSIYLINRPGVGYGSPPADPGFVVTISDSASWDIHLYHQTQYTTDRQGRVLGEWQPDGRNVPPGSQGGDYKNAERLTLAQVFAGVNPVGTWYLWLADWSRRGGTPTLDGWVLEIAAVPEPVLPSLGIASVLIITCSLALRLLRRLPNFVNQRTTKSG